MKLIMNGVSDWKGYRKVDFYVDRRESFVVCPVKTAKGSPWAWRTEFFGAFDTVDMALLERGWHLAYHRTSDMYGCPQAVENMHRFRCAAVEHFGLARRVVLFGFSRGGLYAFNYAVKYPYYTDILYLDAPVLDIRSWPCGKAYSGDCRTQCMDLYGLTEETLPFFNGNPLDKINEVAKNNIPVIIVAGGSDVVVPYSENGAVLAERYRAAGGIIEAIVKPDCGHHPHSLENPAPVVDFIQAHSSAAPALKNTKYCLSVKKKLVAGYFGGSITEGGGDLGWRASVTKWLSSHYPSAEITEIQAAIGGTGTELGVFRCNRDLLEANPDLVFLEFAVNDSGGVWEKVGSDTEAIIRKIYARNPYADIVMVYTITKYIADMLAAGGRYISRDVHDSLARRYGIPSVDIGEALIREVNSSADGDWTRYAPDTVHPNGDGYAVYNAVMYSFMEAALSAETAAPAAKVLPEPMFGGLLTDASLVDAAVTCGEGWHAVEKSMCGRYPHYLEALSPGATLEFEFSGSVVGVYWMMAEDSGDIVFSTDGGEPKTVRSWDEYCLSFSRAGSCILASGLEPGKHRLNITVSDKKSEKSTGNAVRIAAFMVG